MLKHENFKAYNLSSPPGKGVKDKMPNWMDNLLIETNKVKDEKKNAKFPFYGINDPILNPNKIGVNDDNDKK